MNSSLRRIASNYLVCRGELVANPLVEVDGNGVVVSVASYDPLAVDSLPHTEHYSGVMVAGMVNAHCHLELSYLKSQIAQGGGFAEFASSMARVRGAFSEEQRLRAMEAAQVEMWSSGVVAVGDVVNGASSYAVKSHSPIEYVNYAELFGLRSVDCSAVEPLLKHPSTYATPHSLYSLNDELLRRVVDLGYSQQPLSIHLMESAAEGELFKGRGELFEWYERVGFECDFLHYESPAHRLISLVPPDRSVMLVHNCYVEQRDIELIMNHFTAPVHWVVCPRSNGYISGVTPPIDLLSSNGLNICLGTDSLASNTSLSMLDELRSIVSSAPLAERIMWATSNGAAALQLPHLGEIEVGRRPSISLLSNLNYHDWSITPSSVISKIV